MFKCHLLLFPCLLLLYTSLSLSWEPGISLLFEQGPHIKAMRLARGCCPLTFPALGMCSETSKSWNSSEVKPVR